MKKKVGTVLDEKILYKAKKTALEEGMSISRILEEALRLYLDKKEKAASGRGRRNIAQSTHGVMRISQKALKAVMEEEGLYEA